MRDGNFIEIMVRELGILINLVHRLENCFRELTLEALDVPESLSSSFRLILLKFWVELDLELDDIESAPIESALAVDWPT